MFDSLLVANRGEIAGRVIRTANRMGLRTIAVYSEVDASLPFVAEADEAVLIGPAAVAESYRNAYAILKAARATGAQAIHPGYGFLSENSEFAEAGRWVPGWSGWVRPRDAIIAMGDKVAARNLVVGGGVPVAPGTEAPVTTAEAAARGRRADRLPGDDQGRRRRRRHGHGRRRPAGGPGRGVREGHRTSPAGCSVIRPSSSSGTFRGYGTSRCRSSGCRTARVLALGERECSVQRRNQKVVEETPSPALDDALRRRMMAAARRAGEVVHYQGAGTVEFLLSPGRAGR